LGIRRRREGIRAFANGVIRLRSIFNLELDVIKHGKRKKNPRILVGRKEDLGKAGHFFSEPKKG